ncbi:transcriptional regulator [Actinoallomurus rhizosphaericola]|uniref:transcriptional regulator n=1 Tax=Actinoallomurus rhizosphaericola TaxID=2952536 RepID=UPI0020914C4F|nr:transcriptional regulator [Actinoallomurus rhizosphaericola]MCO5991968.1 transcriptional regulator [Actinoallomurus rhizosphaericola]
MEEGFDEFLHVPARLSIVALLAPAEWVEFRFLRETIGTSDSALSKQITALENAGYVAVRKERSGTARRTLVRLTDHGHEAFAAHAAALERIVRTARRRP